MSINLGILGTASIAQQAIIESSRFVPQVKVKAIASRDRLRAQEKSILWNVPEPHTYEGLLENKGIDAIYICTPTLLHTPWIAAAVNNGKHVLCEKPITTSFNQASTIPQSKAVIMEALHHRYHPLTKHLKNILPKIGNITKATGRFALPLPRSNNAFDPFLGGGALLNMGYDIISTLIYFLETEPTITEVVTSTAKSNVDRVTIAWLEFGEETSGKITSAIRSWLCPFWGSLYFKGEKGSIYVLNPFYPHYWNQIRVNIGGKVSWERISGETTYTHQLMAFYSATQGKDTNLTNLENSMKTLKTLDKIRNLSGEFYI